VITHKESLENRWKTALSKLEEIFGGNLDLQGIIFLIGIRELGFGPRNFSKDQKLEVMHVAVCRLLELYGYYEFEGHDQDGWPHWKRLKKLPKLNGDEQNDLMKEAIIEYLEKM
jgi:hypothetical protein